MAISFVVVISSSCKKDDPNNPNNNNQNNNNNNNNQNVVPKFLTIVGAKSLFIGTSTNKSLKDGNGNKLFKVTSEGYVVEVKYLGAKGDTLTNSQFPSNICNLTDNYLTISFDNYGTFLIRKSDGAVFQGNYLPKVLDNNGGMTRQDQLLQQDDAGNLYYILSYAQLDHPVCKLTITDPNNPTTSVYSASGDRVWSFCIDKYGNMAYRGQDASNQNTTRFKSINTGFSNMDNSYQDFWTDISNENIYTIKCQWTSYPQRNMIQKITTNPFGYVQSTDTSITITQIKNSIKLKSKNKLMQFGNDGNGIMSFFEFSNDNYFVPRKINVSHFNLSTTEAIKDMYASNNYYYILGKNTSSNNVILKVNPDDDSYTEFSVSSQYDIYNLTVSANDEIQFYGLRMSDGKRVLAAFNNDGTVRILQLLDGMTISVLERIN